MWSIRGTGPLYSFQQRTLFRRALDQFIHCTTNIGDKINIATFRKSTNDHSSATPYRCRTSSSRATSSTLGVRGIHNTMIKKDPLKYCSVEVTGKETFRVFACPISRSLYSHHTCGNVQANSSVIACRFVFYAVVYRTTC